MTSQDRTPNGTCALVTLLAATATRDQAAFKTLYDATSAKLFGIALAVLRRRHLAEEALQEAYTRIWNNAAHFDPARASPITWMAAIVRNRAIDMLRSQDPESEGDERELLAIATDAPSSFDLVARSEAHRRVRALLGTLDPMKRRLVIAAYLHGESRAQLARRFGAPVPTVKSWLRRAILDMREDVVAKDIREVA